VKEAYVKKILKVAVPSILVLILMFTLRGGKNILDGIYIIFPIIYVVIGLVCKHLLSELLPALLATSLALLIPANVLYNMGTCIDLAAIYIALALAAYGIKKLVKKKRGH
jgi:hypothetical protein